MNSYVTPRKRLHPEKLDLGLKIFETFLCGKRKLFYLCSAKAKWWMQLSRLERRIVVPKVVGSRPIFHPLKRRIEFQFSVFYFNILCRGSYETGGCFIPLFLKTS